MRISQPAWERTQYDLADDFLDLFLPPFYEFAVEADYPRSPVMGPMVDHLGANIEFPESKLLRLEPYWSELSAETFERRLADWPVVLAFEVLQGFGHGAAADLSNTGFAGLRQLANVWGLHLAGEFQRVFRRFEFFTGALDLTADLILVLRQVPAKDLGEMIRGAATPAYVRAGQIASYQYALFNGNQAGMRESQSIIQASDAEIQREIDWLLRGYSSEAMGRHVQRLTLELVTAFKEVLSSDWFKERYLDFWPVMTRQMAWTVGYRLRQNLKNDPARVARLLEAVGHFKEISAVMEEFRFMHGWGGDRDKSIKIAWGAIAPKYFLLSSNVGKIQEDEEQEKLIGLAEGLKDYTIKNRAVNAIEEGFPGKLGAFLKTAASNQARDYARKQKTDGNAILTEARHAEDFRRPDREEDKDLSDDELLSREKEKHRPSGDVVPEEFEAKETLIAWYAALTEKEKTALNLKLDDYSEQDIGKQMGISQQRVSGLIQQALLKWPKNNR